MTCVHLLSNILDWNYGVSFDKYEEHCANTKLELKSLEEAGSHWWSIYADIQMALDHAWELLNKNPEKQPEGIVGLSLKHMSTQGEE